jgi:hypothetical protein
MSTMLTVEAGSHPVASNVRVKLVSHEAVQPKEGYGAGLKFTFETLDGPAPGSKAYRTVSMPVKNTNAAGAFLSQLFGVPALTPQMQLDIDTLVGKVYIADIKQSPKGKGTRVESLVVAPF